MVIFDCRFDCASTLHAQTHKRKVALTLQTSLYFEQIVYVLIGDDVKLSKRIWWTFQVLCTSTATLGTFQNAYRNTNEHYIKPFSKIFLWISAPRKKRGNIFRQFTKWNTIKSKIVGWCSTVIFRFGRKMPKLIISRGNTHQQWNFWSVEVM